MVVALLRGVNVGGKGKLAMADLRDAAAACGIGDARTYVQSGNLVGTTAARDLEKLARQLEAAIAQASTARPDVTVRTQAQLAEVIERSPFRGRDDDPTHLHVIFGIGTGAAVLDLPDLGSYAPEEAEVVGRDVHLLLPNGMGRSKLAADLSRRKSTHGTARNWRTVTTLLEMAEQLA